MNTTPSGRPTLTAQQAAAIHERQVSIALSAGAGCGKTFVLTQRLLTSLEPTNGGADLSSLVAITFTDRAAREMRDRVRAACHQRLQSCPVEETDHWLTILRGLDTARISTIHSFCTGLLRSQAIDAGLDPRFGVLEPALAETLLRNTTRETLNERLEQRDEDAMRFVLEFGLERSRELIRELVSQRFHLIINEEQESDAQDEVSASDPASEVIAAAWLRRWQSEFVPRLIQEIRDSPAVARLVVLLRDNVPTHAKMVERRTVLLEWLAPSSQWPDPLAALEVLEDHARVQGGGTAKSWPSEDIYAQVKDGLTNLRDEVKSLRETLPVNEADLQLAAEFSARGRRLMTHVVRAYSWIKREQGLLDFDDLLLQARDILQNHPDLRQRVSAGIGLLMVDEFQDTDPVQADIVRMLCGDMLTRGRLFFVGDIKQSIYRFRRADPGVFIQFRKETPDPGQLSLTVNFRSQPAVLNFVNHLFSVAMGDTYEPLSPFDPEQHSPTPAIEFLLATTDGSSHEQATEQEPDTPSDSRGEASSTPINAREVRSESSTESGSDRVTAAQLRQREADWIARRCSQLLSDPTPRIRTKGADGRVTLRRVEAGDIVILFRALSNVQDYESALRRQEIDYYLVGGKAFFAQQEVFDLLNLCRYLADPDDLIGLVGVLRSPFFNLSDDAIQALSFQAESFAESPSAGGVAYSEHPSSRVPNLHDILSEEPPGYLDEEQRRRIAFARDVLGELRAIKDRVPLGELLNRAIDRTGYDAALLAEFLGPRKVANLRKLVEMAFEFDASGLFTLRDFVERLGTSVLEETDEEFATTLPETGNVVRLMSIHQSKGLEFPIVIVADIDRKGPPRGRSAVLHPELGVLLKLPDTFGQTHENLGLKMHTLMEREADAHEAVRLFYVACTRAADYLILSAGIEPQITKRSPWFELVASRFDTLTGLPKDDALLGSSVASTAGRESIPEILVHKTPPRCPRIQHETERLVSLKEIPEQVWNAEPAELPSSAKRWPLDSKVLPPLSVSRLEEVDARLLATGPAATRGPLPSESTSSTKRQEPTGANRFDGAGDMDEDAKPIDADQATMLGSLVHAVLEQARFDVPTDADRWLDLQVKTSKDRIDETTLSAAREMLARLWKSSVAEELASCRQLHREVEFALNVPLPDGQAARVIGIIDVLCEDSSGDWRIYDYKTNNIRADAADTELLDPYEFQLGVYALAVEQWFGVGPREMSLIMLRPTIRKVTLDWNPSVRKNIHERLVNAIQGVRTARIDE